MNINAIKTLFLLFIIYSFIGFLLETIYCSLKDKKLANRGFLIGPLVPIYGIGAILMILLLKEYLEDPLVLFIMAVIICSILEYLISFIMEKLYNTRWWDYSAKRFNINGRICLSNAVCFGGLGILLLYYINPLLENVLYKLPVSIFNISFIVLCILFIIDFIISLIVVKEFTKTAKLVKKDSSDEINKKVMELLKTKSLSFLYTRIITAFPDFKVVLKEVKEKFENIKK